jgi:membrane fusion protein, multidrug efflux system
MAENAPIAASAAAPPTTAPTALAPQKPALQKAAPQKPVPEEPAPSKEPGTSHAVWIVLVLLVIIGGIVGYLIYKHENKPLVKPPPAVTISTTNAAKGDIDETVEGLGTVTPIYTAMVSPRVDGQLIKVSYTEGQTVTTNDLLAEIDPGPYAAMLTEAQGQLDRDKALLEGAKVDLTRYEDAYGKSYGTNLHAIPKQQLDDQKWLVHQDEGTVKFDEGQVANAKVQLAYCFINAPFTGRVGLRLVDPGNVIHAANTNAIVVVAQLQPITVVFTVDQKNLPAIQRQLHAGHQMIVEAYNEDKTQKLATGTFLTMDNLIDTATGTIRIKAMFENKDTNLFPNQFVNAKLIIDTLSDVTLIPTATIQRNPQGAFVYVVTNQEVTLTNKTGTVQTNETVVVMHTITTGVTDGDTNSVTGLDPGVVIAADNFNKLGDGMRVNLRGGGQKGGAAGGKKKDGKKSKAQEDQS